MSSVTLCHATVRKHWHAPIQTDNQIQINTKKPVVSTKSLHNHRLLATK